MGRIICIIYAIVGVPMTLLLLSIIVRKLLILLNKTYLWFRRQISSDRRSESKIRFIHLALVLLFSLIFLFLIPSVIFTCLEENWSFIDAFYFCFISLTTIGLGDLVAGDSPTQRNRLFYKICLTGKKQRSLFFWN
jgi:potassium channel subfamily K protein 1